MNTSNEELISKIHKVCLYILLAFDKVCRENDLTYFLDSGTALGAVRHGGFIPWDDDVDVGMPRKDYERFLQIGQGELPQDMFLQTTHTDPLYERNFAKIRLKRTCFQEYKDLPYGENGFFIDIFPFDNVTNNRYRAKIDIIVVRLYYRFLASWWDRKDASSKSRRKIRKIIKIIPKRVILRLNERFVQYCRRYENRDTGYFTCFFWRMSQNRMYRFEVEKMLPVSETLFEGYPVKIARDSDYYLRETYGDYMEIPPENQRSGHHLNGLIDFGDYV